MIASHFQQYLIRQYYFQPPINSIDLKSCITKEFGPVSRDICARAHTFLIEIEREPLPQDTDRLTIIRKKNKTIVR